MPEQEPQPPDTVDPDDLASIEITAGQLSIPVADDDSGVTSQTALSEPPPASSDEPPGIQRVWLRHFKGFDDCSVDLGTFNVLAGANNSGKSTLLQGIDLLFSLLKLHRDGDHLADSGRLIPPGVLPVAAVPDL